MFNITLLIQALNFLIAYWLLSQFFFKPVLNFIRLEAETEHFLNGLVANCHALLRSSYIKRQRLWEKVRSEFGQYTGFSKLIGTKQKACDYGIGDTAELHPVMNETERAQLTQLLINKILGTE